MEYQIEGNPDYGQLTVSLSPGETFLAEAGSMAYMSEGTILKSRLVGGFVKALIRKLVGGESLFVGVYSHPSGGAATFSPNRPGTIVQRTMNGEPFILTAGSFMAATEGVTLNTRFGGLKALFSGEGAFIVEAGGTGELFFNSYGAIIEKEIDGALVVDTGHVVAWESSLDYDVTSVGGLKSTLLSGEGLVLNFSGTGKGYRQTRTMNGSARWVASLSR